MARRSRSPSAKKGEVKVVDEGRGIPIEWKPEVKMSALTLVLTKMHAGGKFDDEDSAGYEGKQKRGLHGAGAKAAVAFAKYFHVEIRRHGLAFRQSYEKVGTPLTPVEICSVDGRSRKKIGEINAETHLVLDKRGIATALDVKGKKFRSTPMRLLALAPQWNFCQIDLCLPRRWSGAIRRRGTLKAWKNFYSRWLSQPRLEICFHRRRQTKNLFLQERFARLSWQVHDGQGVDARRADQLSQRDAR